MEAIRAGAHDYLPKPFEHQQVIRVVLRALNERRLRVELRRLADHVNQVLSPREKFGPSEAAGKLIGAIGVSGDGIDQDDIIAASGTINYLPPGAIRADRMRFRGARLPYAKFPRNPSL